ncbi:MAG TPA: SDR family NAD(P)-dependent oxidoreductase [Caulobacteraceae bacterium]|jgi:NAD(P)-dependent dehydrogenase (short-subunit alcohol dehydrogenase family)
MTGELTGKRIVITGGAKGMAAAMVRDFVRHGAAVVAFDIDEVGGSATTDSATAEGPGRAEFVACDVSSEPSVLAAFAEAVSRLGGLDGLVHAAGIAPGAPAETITLADWESVFAVNARGTFLTNQAAFPYLKSRGGRILNFASSAGMSGLPGKAHYSAAKGAVLAWTRTIAQEWGRYAITANAIAPAIWTPMYAKTRSLMSETQLADHDRMIAAQMPIDGRLGDPDRDLAPVLRFLMGDGARFITGQTIAIDGGLVMVR